MTAGREFQSHRHRERMPRADEIIDYWREDAAELLPGLNAHWIGWGEPFCFRCGWLVPLPEPYVATTWNAVGGWLERAHLIDHCIGGSNDPDNLVMLCGFCHDAMPQLIETVAEGLAWVEKRPLPDMLWQVATDARYGEERWVKYPGRRDMRLFRQWFEEKRLEVMAAVAQSSS